MAPKFSADELRADIERRVRTKDCGIDLARAIELYEHCKLWGVLPSNGGIDDQPYLLITAVFPAIEAAHRPLEIANNPGLEPPPL